jgi:hypothetical protein
MPPGGTPQRVNQQPRGRQLKTTLVGDHVHHAERSKSAPVFGCTPARSPEVVRVATLHGLVNGGVVLRLAAFVKPSGRVHRRPKVALRCAHALPWPHAGALRGPVGRHRPGGALSDRARPTPPRRCSRGELGQGPGGAPGARRSGTARSDAPRLNASPLSTPSCKSIAGAASWTAAWTVSARGWLATAGPGIAHPVKPSEQDQAACPERWN